MFQLQSLFFKGSRFFGLVHVLRVQTPYCMSVCNALVSTNITLPSNGQVSIDSISERFRSVINHMNDPANEDTYLPAAAIPALLPRGNVY